jgi:uncharacterized protein YndB with AHSA1/START domain
MNRTRARILGAIALLFVSRLFIGLGLAGESANGQRRGIAENLKRAEMSDKTTQHVTTKDLVVTRIFDAPVELVWSAWTDPEHVMRWWGPNGFTSPVARIDFREGRTSLVCMRPPKEFGGQDTYNTWFYRKIVPLERIEFILDWADKDGNRVDPAKMGLPPNMPRDVRHVITFKAIGDKKTEMTITEYGYTSDQMLEISKAGLEQCLDKMAATFTKP